MRGGQRATVLPVSVWLSPDGLGLELTLHFRPSQTPLSQEALGIETLLGVQRETGRPRALTLMSTVATGHRRPYCPAK